MQKSWLLDCNCLLNPGLNGISAMGFKFEVADLLLKSYMESFPNSRLNVKGFCIGEGVCEEGTIKKKNYLEVYRGESWSQTIEMKAKSSILTCTWPINCYMGLFDTVLYWTLCSNLQSGSI